MNNKYIHIKGARTHNLKNVSVDIPRNQLVVVTGVSGSGKSSLAFDTLYAEGQRRYVESLSSYARQFMGKMQKPEVDIIEGIPPAIAIEQRTITRNPRSTVGTTTEIYDYLKLLFARIGHTISPISGQEVKRHTIRDVVNHAMQTPVGTKILLLAPIHGIVNKQTLLGILNGWLQEGFSRLWIDGEVVRISDAIHQVQGYIDKVIYLLIDRIVSDHEPTTANRFADSVQTAFYEGKGKCSIWSDKENGLTHFSENFESDGITFIDPCEHLFDFNNPLGACPRCGGYGMVMGIDPNLVVADKSLSIYEGAIACWHGEKMSKWNDALVYHAHLFDFPIHTPFYALTAEQKQLIWTGNEYFKGLDEFFAMLESKQFSRIQYRVMLARYKGKTLCPECNGFRLRKEASNVYVGGYNLPTLCGMSIIELEQCFKQLQISETEKVAAKQLLIEIRSRIQFMKDVGLGYLTLNRMSNTLSGGESQRINLAKSLGSSLVGSLYVLDEPSIGLHLRDTKNLIHVLQELKNLGNTIVVVEHDDEIQKAADHIIDIGPGAGRNGGQIVYAGKPQLEKYTYDIPEYRRKWNNYIEVVGATENNLKNINVKFPLNVISVVTGVSGSGKSTLVSKVLYPALQKYYGGIAEQIGDYGSLRGSMQLIKHVEFIDQNPLSKSSRSNPATYLKAYDEIRKLFAEQQLSKQLGFTAAHFSFNTPGGRCEECQGEGTITIEMQFMADLKLECPHCHGKRFKQDVLEVLYRGKSIYDILEMTVNQAVEFFKEDANCKRLLQRLTPLQEVGIGYVKLGQSSSTLSGGECQRVKLASFLAKENQTPTLFLFDEPTIGLHHKDIKILLRALNVLVSKGHTVIIIEHNPAIILAADHVIDLGPEGGDEGGLIVFEGTPEELMTCEQSHTGTCIKKLLI